jgi:hypothetical protein
MANLTRKEAGKGGKLGHSNMTHYGHTEEVKDAARKSRRVDDRKATQEGLQDLEDHQDYGGESVSRS